MKSTRSIVIVFLVISGCLLQPISVRSQSNKYEFAGLWKSNNNDTILIYQLGFKKPEYLVTKINQLSFIRCTASGNGDSLLHQSEDNPRENSAYFLINPDKNGLFDPLGIIGKKQFFKLTDRNATNCNLKSIPAVSSYFFDYSTNNFCAGLPYDLAPKAILPFNTNNTYISARNINNLKIECYNKTIDKDGPYVVKASDLNYGFNQQGDMTSLQVTQYFGYDTTVVAQINWQYVYAANLLKQITITSEISAQGKTSQTTQQYDEDGWQVDKLGHKTGPHYTRQIFEFVYDKKSGLPIKAIAKCLPGKYQPSIVYQYNAKNQLTKLIYIDPSTSSKRSVEYTYNEKELLKTITNVTLKTE